MRRTTRLVVAAWLVAGPVLVAAAGGPERSAAAVPQLVTLMKSQGLEAVAAPDPERPGRVVAAMLIPDVQILVVAAESTAAAYLQGQMAQRQYRDVYATLNATAVQSTKWFFQDMGCDGLTDGGDAVDVMYEHGTTQTLFDRNWKRQNISKAKYEEQAQKADAEYSRLLTVLRGALEAAPAAEKQ